MKKEYTVEEFVNGYNKLTKTELKDSYVKSLVINDYIGINKKIAHAEMIAKKTLFDENGIFKNNSVARYILTDLELINLYTNINIDFPHMDSEYDLLNRNRLIEKIQSLIPKKEIEEFTVLLNMTCDDIVINYNSPQSFISNQVERFGELIGVSLNPILDKIADNIDNLDDKKIKTIATSFKVLTKKK